MTFPLSRRQFLASTPPPKSGRGRRKAGYQCDGGGSAGEKLAAADDVMDVSDGLGGLSREGGTVKGAQFEATIQAIEVIPALR